MLRLPPLEHFGRTLVALGMEHENLVVLDPDVSASTKTSYFAERFPERFINVGISEQDMIGVAAGLAASGKIPVACGFAIFVAGRAWEQIANSVARPNLNVKIAATHSGLSPYADGDSHQALGDVALMRVIPNMTVEVPADAASTARAVEASVTYRGPVYLRLGRGATPKVYEEDLDYRLGRAKVLRDGSDAAIIANGIILSMALRAAEELAGEGLDIRVVDMHTVKPLDAHCVAEAAEETGAIVTAEEHSTIGGLGSAVAEALAESRLTPIRRVGVDDRFGESSRAYSSLLRRLGLTPESIAEAAREVVGRRR
ncbi:MAG: transketolase family protein [Candidatus Bathyarchaeia archaeon]